MIEKLFEKKWLLWTVRLGLLAAAGILGYLAQSRMPGVEQASALSNRWMAAAPGFRLYGWACLCFVLACLPGARVENLRPLQPHRIIGLVCLALAILLIGTGIWGLYRFHQFMLGFPFLFAGFAFLGIAYPCLVENPIAKRREEEKKAAEEAQGMGDPYQSPPDAVQPDSFLKKPRWLTLLPHALTWLGVIISFYSLLLWYREIHQAKPFIPLLIGILIGGAGVYLMDRLRGLRYWNSEDLFELWELPFLVGILALAIFLRFRNLDTIPLGIWYDEAELGLETRRILSGAPYSPMAAFSKNPSLPFYLNALFLYFLGDTLWSLRSVVATVGVVSVVGMYLLAREMFGRWAGLIASFLLACGFWHINFSRFNMQNVLAPGAAIWMFYFLFRGLKYQRRLDFLLSGLLMGIGMHTYTGFRVAPPILIPLVIVALIFQKRFLRDFLYSLILMGVFSSIAFIPLGAFALRNPREFTARMDQTSVFRPGRSEQQKWSDFRKNFVEHYQMFHYWGDRNPRHGLTAAPKVDFASGVLMMLGLALAWYRWRDLRYFLLPVWLALSLMAGILSLEFESPQTARTITAIPVAFLLGALALDEVRKALAGALPIAGRYVFLLLLFPLGAFVAHENYDIYFNRQMKRGDTWSEFSGLDTAVARYLLTLGERDLIYHQSEGTRQSAYLLATKPFTSRFFHAYKDFPPVEVIPDDTRVTYLLEHWRSSLPEKFWKHYFPDGEYQEYTSPQGAPIFFTFTVTGRQINQARGVMITLPDSSKELSAPQLPIVPEEWTGGMGQVLPARLRISSLLYVPRSGAYHFRVSGGFTGQVKINRIQVMPVEHPNLLVKGWNSLEMEGTWSGEGPLQLVWQNPPGEEFRPVENQYLYRLTLPEFGLLGLYYSNTSWMGHPEFRQVDPYPSFRWHPDLFAQNWSAIWQGWLMAPEQGSYQLMMVSNDMAQLFLDDRLVLKQERDGWRNATVDLDERPVPIRIQYRQGTGYSELRLHWMGPRRGREVIGPNYLLPARS